MKKIFYFIASAIVALGAVACQNEIDENIDNNQQTEGLSIKVTIDEQTRVDLGVLNAENKRKLTFTDGDVLVARANRYSGTNYFFTYTQTEGDVYTFTCTDDGVSELIGTRPYFFYLGGLHEQVNELLGSGYTYFCNTAAEDISGIGLYASNKDYDHNQKNLGEEGHKVSLHALPLLKFTAYEPVTFKSTHRSQFFVDNGYNDSYTTKKTGEIYLPIMSSGGNEYTVTVTTESGFNKTFTKVFDENTIYNLGTIAVASTVWGIAGELNGWDNTEAGATKLYEGDGYLYATNLTNLNGGGFKFSRLGSWDGAMGSTTTTAVTANTWNACGNNNIVAPTADAYDVYFLPLHGKYYIATAGSAVPEIPGFAVAGDFNTWADLVMETTETDGLYVAKGVTLTEEYSKLKIKEKGNWDVSYGGGINYLESNKFMKVFSNGSDIAVVEAGTFDIYFDLANTNLYLMKSGVNYATANLQSADGPAPAPADPKPDTVTLYLKTDWGWTDWALYAWGGSGTWGEFNKWPGKAMEDTATIGGVTYKAWDIPASCVGQSGIQVIVTGKEDGVKQTKDTPIDVSKDVFVEITDWDGSVGKATLTVLTSPY